MLNMMLSEEKRAAYITNKELYYVLKSRLTEMGYINEEQFSMQDGGVSAMPVWGVRNEVLEGELIKLEDLIQFNQMIATEHEICFEFEFDFSTENPYKIEISKIYPPLWFPETPQQTKQIEDFYGSDYKNIPPRCFAEHWKAKEVFQRNFSSYCTNFEQAQWVLLYHLGRINNGSEMFPKFPVKEKVSDIKKAMSKSKAKLKTKASAKEINDLLKTIKY